MVTQDATNAANKAGLMFRDSISNTSPFAFVATTSSSGIVFEYRSVSGGSTTVVSIPSLAAPYWIELNKSGTKYSAYISSSGAANSWTQIGPTVDLGFGTSPVYLGMAVTSANNAKLSTATIANFTEVSSPLLIKLISFTGTNINNQNILLKWATSSEINTNYFDVQRNDGNAGFQSIGRVNASTNSTVQQNYSAIDYHPNPGANLYRLMEVDLDGTISYSPTVEVNFGIQEAPQISPNPASSYFVVTAGLEPIKEISIVDVSGKVIEHIINNGSSDITISSANLISAVYIVRIITTSKVYQQKLFKH